MTYTEEELLAVYEDLLALPPSGNIDAQAQQLEDHGVQAAALQLVTQAADRLCVSAPDGSVLLHRVLLDRLEEVIQTLEETGASVGLGDITENIPLSVVTEKEWEALIQVTVRSGFSLHV